jgi:hypothetical protein
LCPICAHLEQAPHLRPKKLTPADKLRAHRMMRGLLRSRAALLERKLSEEDEEALLADADLAERAALVAYCEQLLRRIAGEPGEPAVLALWRKFAWTRNGSPKKDFTLDLASVLDAERAIVERLAPG